MTAISLRAGLTISIHKSICASTASSAFSPSTSYLSSVLDTRSAQGNWRSKYPSHTVQPGLNPLPSLCDPTYFNHKETTLKECLDMNGLAFKANGSCAHLRDSNAALTSSRNALGITAWEQSHRLGTAMVVDCFTTVRTPSKWIRVDPNQEIWRHLNFKEFVAHQGRKLYFLNGAKHARRRLSQY